MNSVYVACPGAEDPVTSTGTVRWGMAMLGIASLLLRVAQILAGYGAHGRGQSRKVVQPAAPQTQTV